MRFDQALTSYLPSTIVDELERPEYDQEKGGLLTTASLPIRQTLPHGAVCAFFDISGYTLLNERMNVLHKGRGAEHVAAAVNAYFQMMVRLIFSNGGDVVKFAGDAAIVIWPLGSEPLSVRCLRAIRCAFDIQAWLEDFVVIGKSTKNEEGGIEGSIDISSRRAPPMKANSTGAAVAAAAAAAKSSAGGANDKSMNLAVKIGIGVGDLTLLHLGGVLGRVEYVALGDGLTQVC